MESSGNPDALDADLERQLDTVARAEREAAERHAAQLAARRQSLADVCWQAVQSGSRLTVGIGTVDLSGVAVYARGDLLSLETNYGLAEINLAAIDMLLVDDANSTKGLPLPHEAESFMARLSTLQLAGETVEILTRLVGWRGEGMVETVARDHVVLATARGPVHVPMTGIAAVIRRTTL